LLVSARADSGLASDLKFERRSTLRLLCLAATPDTLYACSDEHSGLTVGASSDGGFTFELSPFVRSPELSVWPVIAMHKAG
jgi:hypothetical protein